MYGWFSRVGKPDPKPGQIWRWFKYAISPWPELDTDMRIRIVDVRGGSVKYEYLSAFKRRSGMHAMPIKELKEWWKLEKDVNLEN